MIELTVTPGLGSAQALASIKFLAHDHPGEQELTLVVWTQAGNRRLGLGPMWRYSGSPDCLAALGEFGDVQQLSAS